jgi:hypothetical protein
MIMSVTANVFRNEVYDLNVHVMPRLCAGTTRRAFRARQAQRRVAVTLH